MTPSECTEWYRKDNKVELQDDEKMLIENNIDHLTTIIGSVFGNLEEFDQFGRQVAVCNLNTGKPIGVELAHALYGEQEIQSNPNYNQFEQFNRIVLGNNFVTVLLNRDNSIREIQTNINTEKPYTVFKWMENAYKQIDMILNSPDIFYLEGDGFAYHGPEETEDVLEI